MKSSIVAHRSRGSLALGLLFAAGGAALRTPTSAASLLAIDGNVTVQLLSSEGECWASDFTVAKKNTVGQIKTKPPLRERLS